MRIELYKDEYKHIWDSFVDESKNGTFLHNRDYLEYHSDRFKDYSLMIFDGNDDYEDSRKESELLALLPANVKGDRLYSHAGLTYGGLIISKNIGQIKVCEIFTVIRDFLKLNNFSELYYKLIPSVYHKIAADEDQYALFSIGAKLIDRKASSAIYQPEKLAINKRRKRGVKRAVDRGVKLSEHSDLTAYWDILTENLNARYGKSPVHSVEEISRLQSLFPENIKCHTVEIEGEIVAGVLMFITHSCAHAQYISASEKGKKNNALDLLFDILINDIYKDLRWFDFGISTEPHDFRILNEGLINQKENFGARTIIYDSYVLNI